MLNKKYYIPYLGFYDLRMFELSGKEFFAAWRVQEFLYHATLRRDYYKEFAPMEWERIKELSEYFQMYLLPRLKPEKTK